MEQCVLCLKVVEQQQPHHSWASSPRPSTQDVVSLYKLLTLDSSSPPQNINNGLTNTQQDEGNNCSLCSTCTELIEEMGQIREQISQLQNQFGKRIGLLRNMILESDVKRLDQLLKCEVDDMEKLRDDLLLRLTAQDNNTLFTSTEADDVEIKMEPEDDFGEDEDDQFLEDQDPCSSASDFLHTEEAGKYSSTDDDYDNNDLEEEGESDSSSSFIINPQKTKGKQIVLRRSGRTRSATAACVESGNNKKLKRSTTPNSNPTSRESPKMKTSRKSLECKRRHCSNRRHPNKEALARHDKECHFAWKCQNCDNQTFNLRSQLVTHYKSEHPIIPFLQCSICRAEFLYKKSLEEHMFIQHETEEKAFSCDKCGKGFTLELNYKRHLVLHKDEREKPIVCEICDCRCLDKARFDKHFATHKIKKCKLCSKVYAHKSSLKLHMRIHTGEKPLKCDHCDETFSFHRRKRIHMAKVHSIKKVASIPDRDHLCPICGNTYTTAHSLKIHLTRHDGTFRMRCGQCGEIFKEQTALRRHRIEKHGAKTLICEESSAEFKSASNYFSHKRFHHKIVEKPHKCDKCDAAFNYKCMLTQHVDEVHSHLRAYPCPNCEAKFNRKHNLSSHIQRKHTEGYVRPTPHSCSYPGCEKKFEKKTKVEEHIRREHTMEKPFVCEVCNRGYPARSGLNLHKRRWPEGSCSKFR